MSSAVFAPVLCWPKCSTSASSRLAARPVALQEALLASWFAPHVKVVSATTREPAYSSWSCASRAATVAAQPGFECQFNYPDAGAGLWATFHTGMGVGRVIYKASPAPARSGGRRERSVANRPSVAIAYAVLPNPSFKPSPNGGPPGPGCRYAVHFLHPGPGVPPSVPA